MIHNIQANVHYLIRILYPIMKMIEFASGEVLTVLGEYKPLIYYLIVTWAPPPLGHQKCNTDGTSRGNPGPISYGLCIRDRRGDLCYAKAGLLGQNTNIQAEAQALQEAVKYWGQKSMLTRY